MASLKEIYELHLDFENRYKALKAKADTAGMENLRKEYIKWTEKLDRSNDEGFLYAYRLYKDAMDRKNDYIDISELVREREVEPLIRTFRENGIEHFTFSSTWTSTVETAWLFLQNGCTLEGMLEITRNPVNLVIERPETKPAYLFKVNI